VRTLEKQDRSEHIQTLQFAVVAKRERGLLIPEDRMLSETNLPSRTMLQCNQIEKHNVG
jgi:hypothetical protein